MQNHNHLAKTTNHQNKIVTQRFNPRTHRSISPPCFQIKPIEKNWKGSSFIGSNPSCEIASSREPEGE